MTSRQHKENGLILAVGVAVLAGLLGSAHGYVPILTTNDNLVRWNLEETGEDQPNIIEGSVEFFTNRTGTADIVDQGNGVGGEFEILRLAFRAWEAVGSSRIDFNDLKLTDQMFLSPTDNTNVIGFDETNGTGLFPAGSGIIALTLLTYEDEQFEGRFDGRIVDADLIFNGSEFVFGGDGEPDRIDLQAVATHEVGHICGLDHSFLRHTNPVDLSVETTTMFPIFDLGETQARTLEADDIAGITELYPNEEVSEALYGSISGRVIRAGAKGGVNTVEPLYGVDVVAYQGDTPVVSTITRSDGIYRMFGVPAGEYILRTLPISPSHVGLPFDPETDIQSQFYNAAGLSTDASAITVSAGRRRFDLNFELPRSTAPDFFEPNDNAGQATNLAVNGGRMIHQFYRSADEDWVRFDATSGGIYDLITDNLAYFADPVITLFGADGVTLLAQNDDVSSQNLAARVRFTATQTGPHFVRLTDAEDFFGDGTSFEFSIQSFGVPLAFDANDDGEVNSLDLLYLANHWQTNLEESAKRQSMRVDSELVLKLLVALGGEE